MGSRSIDGIIMKVEENVQIVTEAVVKYYGEKTIFVKWQVKLYEESDLKKKNAEPSILFDV